MSVCECLLASVDGSGGVGRIHSFDFQTAKVSLRILPLSRRPWKWVRGVLSVQNDVSNTHSGSVFAHVGLCNWMDLII
jgi:hypothetical protein